MESCILTKLPYELLDRILGAISSLEDLRSLRLTCHVFHNYATRWLFKDVYTHILEESHEDFQQIVEKFGHHAQTLYVDGDCGMRQDGLCPFEVAPLLEKMPLLRRLKMTGTVTLGGDKTGMLDFIDTLKRSSLQTPPEQRILSNLRSRMPSSLLPFFPLDGVEAN